MYLKSYSKLCVPDTPRLLVWGEKEPPGCSFQQAQGKRVDVEYGLNVCSNSQNSSFWAIEWPQTSMIGLHIGQRQGHQGFPTTSHSEATHGVQWHGKFLLFEYFDPKGGQAMSHALWCYLSGMVLGQECARKGCQVDARNDAVFKRTKENAGSGHKFVSDHRKITGAACRIKVSFGS